MSNGPQMFRVNPENKETKEITEVNFADLGLSERADIQEWIADNPGILGDDFLIIGKEFSGFEGSRERPDLLAVDTDGKLVVIELKRDDSGADVHWQAIKYASYFSHAKVEEIVGILACYKGISKSAAETDLLKHLNAENAEGLNALNHDQRIILASHRFAPEVTSAVLWLNEKASNENLITCVQLTPYRDEEANSLYLQASTIIPVPGVDIVGVGSSLREGGGRNPNASDEVTDFIKKVRDLVKNGLPDEIRPDKTNRWALNYYGMRYYQFWYSRQPWKLNLDHLLYQVGLHGEKETDKWQANVLFRYPLDMKENFDDISVHDEQEVHQRQGFADIMVEVGTDTLNDHFGEEIAAMVRKFIETITPVVDGLANESDGEA